MMAKRPDQYPHPWSVPSDEDASPKPPARSALGSAKKASRAGTSGAARRRSTPKAADAPPPPAIPLRARRGRPPGSVSLTKETADTIVVYVGAGAALSAAAEAAGISERTLYDWLARGEGRHPSRKATPKLKRFARDVRRANARARVVAETEVFRTDPKWWLTRRDRFEPGRSGWGDPLRDPTQPPVSDEQMKDAKERLLAKLEETAERARATDPEAS